jgi:hypothetical protein
MGIGVTLHIGPGPYTDCKIAPEAYSAIGDTMAFCLVRSLR